MHTIQSTYMYVVETPLYHQSLKILRQQTPWQQIYQYFIDSLIWEGHIFPSDSVVQSCPPCTQCSTSEQAVFHPAGAMTRSSSPSSQPLLACAVTHIDLGHVIHCLWPLLWRFLSLLHVLIIYVTINLVNWKLVTSRLNLVDKVVAT